MSTFDDDDHTPRKSKETTFRSAWFRSCRKRGKVSRWAQARKQTQEGEQESMVVRVFTYSAGVEVLKVHHNALCFENRANQMRQKVSVVDKVCTDHNIRYHR